MKIVIQIFFSLLIANVVSAQSNVSFGQVSFTEPVNWTLNDNASYRAYSTVNNTSNIFSIISIYGCDVSSGNDEQGFQNEWKGTVDGHFMVLKNLKPQKNITTRGIKYLTDEANVSNNKGSFSTSLLVFDLKEKTQSVLFLSQNKNMLAQSQPDLDNFISSIKLNDMENTNVASDTPVSTNANNGNASSLSSTGKGSVQFIHFIFDVPAGWKTTNQPTFFAITPPDLAAGEIFSYVMLTPIHDAGFAQAAETTINEIATSLSGKPSYEISGSGPYYVKENEGTYAKGWEFSKGHALVISKNGKDAFGLDQLITWYVGVFLAKINSRIERVVFISKDVRRNFLDCRTYLKPAYEPVIKNFFFDLEFDDWKDAGLHPGKITHTGISSQWQGLAYFEGSEGQTFSEGSEKVTYLAFFDNGQVYYNKQLPKRGFLNINTYSEAAVNPRWWGTYTYQNGSGVIKLPYETIPFTLKDGKIYLDIYKTKIPYEPSLVPDGMHLNGTWCEKSVFNSKPACISFTNNGQFTDNRIVLRIEHPIDICFQAAPESGQGTYIIEDNSILFQYDNGFSYQAAFSGLNIQGKNPSPNEIHLGFNDDTFQKQ